MQPQKASWHCRNQATSGNHPACQLMIWANLTVCCGVLAPVDSVGCHAGKIRALSESPASFRKAWGALSTPLLAFVAGMALRAAPTPQSLVVGICDG